MLVKYLSFANDHLSGQGVKNKRELNLIFYDLSILLSREKQAGRRVVAGSSSNGMLLMILL